MMQQLRADVARHGSLSNPAVWPLLVYRLGRAADGLPRPLRGAGSRLYGIACLGLHLTVGTVLHRETRIGDALHFIHGANVRIHPDVVFGDRVGLNHDVTIGAHHRKAGVPRIGSDVFIGAGATILGPVTIGDGAVIAANSLVLNDVPPGATAMGVPARPLPRRRSDPSSTRAR